MARNSATKWQAPDNGRGVIGERRPALSFNLQRRITPPLLVPRVADQMVKSGYGYHETEAHTGRHSEAHL